ncbi:hypothetical protein M404DRAFT_991338 [Pisolithus tinctorius Marx 270]|uniref:ALIX V-shaped domain-containing protein n=1 Tax=Pisolithus tinctorius Marx 270 TaxID=870435 RepID=A0A0C3PYA5_PISTI|nr:hypothetical protein M404DRAFT_991338 [Pisolithus tinctorius Marx 270]
MANKQTQVHARAFRALLESLDDIRKDRSQLVARAQRLVEADDIKPSIISAASNFNRWEEPTPAIFVDVSDAELAKYDRYIQGLAEGKKKQGILEAIESKNEQFLSSRKEDPAVKDREIILHNLDMAYAKYLKISGNLNEGGKAQWVTTIFMITVKFYKQDSKYPLWSKEACRLWGTRRSQEVQ